MARKSRATKGEPFSIRLSKPTDQFVTEEARRTKRSKSAIVEALTEEAARMRRFPGIAFRGPDGSRDAWVIGTALDVWQIIEAYRDFGSIERMLAEPALMREFRADPHAVLDRAQIQSQTLTGIQTLELRESRSSLAGALTAAAAEGFAILDILNDAPGAAASAARSSGAQTPERSITPVERADAPPAAESVTDG